MTANRPHDELVARRAADLLADGRRDLHGCRERDLEVLAQLIRQRPSQRPPAAPIALHVLARRRAKEEVQR